MKIFKLAIISALLLCCANATASSEFNGNTFYEGYRALNQEPGFSSEDNIDYGFAFAGFVRGVAGLLIAQKRICVDVDNFQFTQAFDAVGNYLKAHPKARSQPPLVPTIIALNEEFPCPKGQRDKK